MNYRIISNEALTKGSAPVLKMVLEGDTSRISAPGQFVNIKIPGKFLRRPISICDWDESTITIVYRVVGEGTKEMSSMIAGDSVEMLTGLGNGFRMLEGVKPLLVGGGVGLPPMLALAKAYLAKGVVPEVVAGFASKDDVVLVEEFAAAGIGLKIATMDGSRGVKGTVMEIIKGVDFDSFYACGPKPMLRALQALSQPGLLSVEERMGCGFGVCMGCTCKTVNGLKRVCKDGPVFDKEDMLC